MTGGSGWRLAVGKCTSQLGRHAVPTLPNFAQELSGRSDGQAVHASAEKVVEVIPIKRQEISGLLAKGGNDYRAIFGGPVDERPIKRQPRGCRNEGGPDNLVPA